MRRSLLLLRHAKAKRPTPDLEDFDRALNGRGRDAARLVGKLLRSERLVPDLVLFSPARRTRETWELVENALGKKVPAAHDGALYLANPTTILKIVRRQADAVRRLMVVGHNPGLERLALALAGEAAEDDIARMHAKFPTAALAAISFEARRWRDIDPGTGRLERYLVPRDMAEPV